MLGKQMTRPAALSTLGLFSTVPIGFNRSPLSSVTDQIEVVYVKKTSDSACQIKNTHFFKASA